MARKNSLKKTTISKKVVKTQHKRSKSQPRKVTKLLRDRMRQARYLLSTLGCLVVADGVISNFIVRNGLGKEANPFVQSIVGQTSFIFIKLVAAIIAALLLWKFFKRHHRLGLVSIVLYVLIYTAILWWNLTIWFTGVHNTSF